MSGEDVSRDLLVWSTVSDSDLSDLSGLLDDLRDFPAEEELATLSMWAVSEEEGERAYNLAVRAPAGPSRPPEARAWCPSGRSTRWLSVSSTQIERPAREESGRARPDALEWVRPQRRCCVGVPKVTPTTAPTVLPELVTSKDFSAADGKGELSLGVRERRCKVPSVLPDRSIPFVDLPEDFVPIRDRLLGDEVERGFPRPAGQGEAWALGWSRQHDAVWQRPGRLRQPESPNVSCRDPRVREATLSERFQKCI